MIGAVGLLVGTGREAASTTYRKRSQMAICVATVVIGNALNAEALVNGVDGTAALIARIAFSVALTICGSRAGFASLTTTEEGIGVSNTFSSFALRWGEIERFEIGRWKLLPYVCQIRLKDGGTLHATGIQENTRWRDGSAEGIADGLNAELARQA